MKVGFVGLGKLGLPVALSIEDKGHEVYGFDINPAVYEYVESREIPYLEEGTPELLAKTKITMCRDVETVVAKSEMVFCPVQTPHNPMYEGVTRLPDERVDFDYTYLKAAVESIATSAAKLEKRTTLVVISTVLPGTIEREIKPLLNEYIEFAYEPLFIAMGTTRSDFENPEFVLLGMDESEVAINKVKEFYKTIHERPVFVTTVKSAELIKVAYNTFISSKISIITTLQQICELTGANIDAVSDAFALATDRLISAKYLRGGMPDGGGCHPRDNIALSWLSRKLRLPYDWFEGIMKQREAMVEWYAQIIYEMYSQRAYLPVVILGKSFKRGTNLVVGSPAVLLSNILNEKGVVHTMYDPHIDQPQAITNPAIFFIGCNHSEFETMKFPARSIVIDVWGMVKDQDGVEVRRIGRS